MLLFFLRPTPAVGPHGSLQRPAASGSAASDSEPAAKARLEAALKINQRDKHIRDLRDATPARAADLERLERSLCRLSLQMEHMQVIKKPEWSFHTFAMPEKTASSAHTIFVRPPSGNRIEVTIPPGKQPDELFTVMLEDVHAYPCLLYTSPSPRDRG